MPSPPEQLSTVRVAEPTDAEVERWLELDRVSFEDGWVDGYKAGFAAGWDVGARAALEDHEKHWQQLARWYVQHTCPGQYDPRQPRGAAYEEALRRRGGREYRGGPVHWLTGRPARKRGAA